MQALADYIKTAANKAGSLSALSRLLTMNQPDISKAANGRGRIPLTAAVQLADYIEADPLAVISANELVTERKPEKRAFWMQHARAASIALACAVVTNFVTPYPAEAAEKADRARIDVISITQSICIM
ncbi:MAG: hypothetical protein FWF12_04010 [Betaproteobacteria bacterium]|nr:hypothetical protein [Betaproteobacteria bacterium]